MIEIVTLGVFDDDRVWGLAYFPEAEGYGLVGVPIENIRECTVSYTERAA